MFLQTENYDNDKIVQMCRLIWIFPVLTCQLVPYAVYHMGESFQDSSWIQDFEADFPQKVSLKMLN